MSIAQAVQNKIEAMPAGQIFGYQELPNYSQSPTAVIKAVSRLVADKKLERLSKGKFYVQKRGLLGPRKPSDSELIRSILYKNGYLCGYVTGLSLYNQLGLTTQIPRTITLACNGGRQEKDFGTIRIRKVASRIPVREEDVKLLQYLDVLRDIKKIPDADVNQTLKVMCRYISELLEEERRRLAGLAESYYGPQVKALVGMLLTSLGAVVPPSLLRSLNPTSTYTLNLDQMMWPMAREWNIR